MRRATAVLAVVLLIWWLLPVYNLLLIALDPEGDTEFTGDIWPSDPTLQAFVGVFSESYWYLKDFWLQFGNSFFIGAMTMALTALISSLGSFALGRMWRGRAARCRPLPCSCTRCRSISWSFRSIG